MYIANLRNKMNYEPQSECSEFQLHILWACRHYPCGWKLGTEEIGNSFCFSMGYSKMLQAGKERKEKKLQAKTLIPFATSSCFVLLFHISTSGWVGLAGSSHSASALSPWGRAVLSWQLLYWGSANLADNFHASRYCAADPLGHPLNSFARVLAKGNSTFLQIFSFNYFK